MGIPNIGWLNIKCNLQDGTYPRAFTQPQPTLYAPGTCRKHAPLPSLILCSHEDASGRIFHKNGVQGRMMVHLATNSDYVPEGNV